MEEKVVSIPNFDDELPAILTLSRDLGAATSTNNDESKEMEQPQSLPIQTVTRGQRVMVKWEGDGLTYPAFCNGLVTKSAGQKVSVYWDHGLILVSEVDLKDCSHDLAFATADYVLKEWELDKKMTKMGNIIYQMLQARMNDGLEDYVKKRLRLGQHALTFKILSITTVENRFLRGEYEKTKKELGNRRHASDGTVLRVQDQEDIGLHCTSSPHALTQILQKGYVPRDIPCRHQMPSERITADMVLERVGYI